MQQWLKCSCLQLFSSKLAFLLKCLLQLFSASSTFTNLDNYQEILLCGCYLPLNSTILRLFVLKFSPLSWGWGGGQSNFRKLKIRIPDSKYEGMPYTLSSVGKYISSFEERTTTTSPRRAVRKKPICLIIRSGFVAVKTYCTLWQWKISKAYCHLDVEPWLL